MPSSRGTVRHQDRGSRDSVVLADVASDRRREPLPRGCQASSTSSPARGYAEGAVASLTAHEENNENQRDEDEHSDRGED